ncbi:rhodanese-like domain-containing protein [Solemya velum gill symbiont]|nr:rhodanese-like domain-containing protein [Solemya velum gill symbiont]OOY33777.1 sulfurtransferase [Solemya velum gill symbiont]OOY36424.1 sulfurtransferase [Solemya velum gill symbiont]OOY38960.1 sulfurtransferase [Solemya velum gill symbiont]OOY41659.1 sulfurtransferase [Solemya velum gill symbiont]OOY43133.1 sulfurtransferase [Solemya velum gill symbiont]
MQKLIDLLAERLESVNEIMPWDMEEMMEADPDLLVLDVRERDEFDTMHVENSLNVPRGIVESACEWGYEETEPELVEARDRTVIVVCRSGYRSIMTSFNLQLLGFNKVYSLTTGLRGYNDYELPFVDLEEKPVDIKDADAFFVNKILPYQMEPDSE